VGVGLRPVNAAPADSDSPVGDISRLARIFSNVVAPTTAVTGLLFYFGWSHAYWFFHYFGVNSTLLGLSTRDYLMRSLDGLFVPVTVLAAVALLVLWVRVFGYAVLRPTLRARLERLLDRVVPVVGLALVLNALSRLFWETWVNTAPAVAPLGLTAGVLLLAWAVHRRRSQSLSTGGIITRRPWVSVVEWASVFLLVGLSLFWAANDYSAAVGGARARELVASLSNQPNVILYSERSLSMNVPGVRETRCADSQAAYRFRYDGLKLVLHSDNQYVLLPATWTPERGVAIVMPRHNTLRLEFVRASVAPGLPDPTC
jgi:hypothetical protein